MGGDPRCFLGTGSTDHFLQPLSLVGQIYTENCQYQLWDRKQVE